MTAASLAAAFGDTNVTNEDISIGEGFFEQGTVLFSTAPEDRVEILWQVEGVQQTPRLIVVRGQKSRWRTAQGLTLGLSLQAVERLNRRPFRLSGFGWDYGGGARNWLGGALARQAHEKCALVARLAAPQRADGSIVNERFFRQIVGERQYSSGHPAMQVVNPIVCEIYLEYRY